MAIMVDSSDSCLIKLDLMAHSYVSYHEESSSEKDQVFFKS